MDGSLPFEGLEYEAIKEFVERSSALYLERWSRAIAADRPAPERTSRAIATHLLDFGVPFGFYAPLVDMAFSQPTRCRPGPARENITP
jgi:hypothetical protein